MCIGVKLYYDDIIFDFKVGIILIFYVMLIVLKVKKNDIYIVFLYDKYWKIL